MIYATQHTDSENQSDVPCSNVSFPSVGDITEGTTESPLTFSLSGEPNPVRQAKAMASRIANPSAAKQVKKLLSAIQRLITLTQKQGVYVDQIPPLRATEADDGSVLLEWIFPDFRAGFNIEANAEDSGWHLVSSKRLGDIAISGPLSPMEVVVAILLEYILKNT